MMLFKKYLLLLGLFFLFFSSRLFSFEKADVSCQLVFDVCHVEKSDEFDMHPGRLQFELDAGVLSEKFYAGGKISVLQSEDDFWNCDTSHEDWWVGYTPVSWLSVSLHDNMNCAGSRMVSRDAKVNLGAMGSDGITLCADILDLIESSLGSMKIYASVPYNGNRSFFEDDGDFDFCTAVSCNYNDTVIFSCSLKDVFDHKERAMGLFVQADLFPVSSINMCFSSGISFGLGDDAECWIDGIDYSKSRIVKGKKMLTTSGMFFHKAVNVMFDCAISLDRCDSYSKHECEYYGEVSVLKNFGTDFSASGNFAVYSGGALDTCIETGVQLKVPFDEKKSIGFGLVSFADSGKSFGFKFPVTLRGCF